MYLRVLNISGVAAVLLAEGRRRLPRWFFSHSASRAMIQTRCRSGQAGFETPEFAVATDISDPPRHFDFTQARSDIKLASAAFFRSSPLRWEKAFADLTRCLKDKHRKEEVFQNTSLSHLAVAQKLFLTKSIILSPAALTALWHWNVGALSNF